MNLYEFPTHTSKQNDALVWQFVLMTSDMTNEGLVRFMTGFLVAKFHLFAESQQNFTLRESLFKELIGLERQKITREDFIRGAVQILQNNGQIEKIYVESRAEDNPDRIDRLVIERQQTPINNSQGSMIHEITPEKAMRVNRIKLEEERMAEKMERESMRQLTQRKAVQYQQRRDQVSTPRKNSFSSRNHFQMQIRCLKEQQEELEVALKQVLDFEAQNPEFCYACQQNIRLEDIGRLECEHTFHRECMTSIILQSILKLNPLRRCPVQNCGKDIPISDIKCFIDAQEQDRYAELVVKRNWYKNQTKNVTKKQNQPGNVEKDDEVKPKVITDKKPKANPEYKKCPKCSTLVQKVSDYNLLLCNCGAMICISCGGTWCVGDKCIFENIDPKGQPKKPNQKK